MGIGTDTEYLPQYQNFWSVETGGRGVGTLARLPHSATRVHGIGWLNRKPEVVMT